MKVDFIGCHNGGSGSLINMWDMAHNVNKYYNVRYYINKSFNEIYNLYKWTKRSYKILFNREKYIEGEVLITDIISLLRMDCGVRYDKVIIFDNVELSLHLYGLKLSRCYYEYDLNDEIGNKIESDDIVFKMVPCICKKFSERYGYRYESYLKKIDYDLLSDKLNNGPLRYKRKEHLCRFEQFGRTVYEYLMMGFPIESIENPDGNDDGFRDYNKYCSVYSEREEIINKMRVIVENI